MLLDHLCERVITKWPGSNRVVDLRNPEVKSDNTDTHITLTKDGGAILWAYPNAAKDPNRLEWRDEDEKGGPGLLSTIKRACDTELQPDAMGMRFTPTGVQISLWREGPSWSGHRNRFSQDTREVVARLLDLGIVTPRTPIFYGNWARRDEDGDLAGSVAQILKAPSIPNRIMLYHGTSNARAEEILQHGLSPMDKNMRTQKEQTETEHRPDCIYLTASRQQAEYYARKAMNIDRKRLSYRYRSDVFYKMRVLNQDLEMAKQSGNEKKADKVAEKLDKLKQAYSVMERMAKATDTVEPVILGIELTRADYRHLLADDDYIGKMMKNGKEVSVDDWRDSLSDFGQVAYRGTIPPSKIKKID